MKKEAWEEVVRGEKVMQWKGKGIKGWRRKGKRWRRIGGKVGGKEGGRGETEKGKRKGRPRKQITVVDVMVAREGD